MHGKIFLVFILFFIISCQSATTTITPDPNKVVVPNCKPIVKYSATSFSIKGIEIPLSTVPVKIGEVTWDPKLIQQAHVVTQILDMKRMSNCEMLPAYASLGREEYKKHLDEISDDNDRLFQLALLVANGNQDGVKKWIEVYSNRANAVATPEIINKIAKSNNIDPQAIHAQLMSLKTTKDFVASSTDMVVPLESLMKK